MRSSRPGSGYTKVSERIRDELENEIESGQLLPGEPIDEAELATTYRVSRTPVREALLQLQVLGLLSSRPRGGMIVAKMDLPQLLSMWELLAELEGVAARLACQRLSDRGLAELAAHHAESRQVMESDDSKSWQASNLLFHEFIYAATNNPYLRQDIMRMRALTGYYRRHAFGALGRVGISFEQHDRIVAALQQRDAGAAASEMVSHMRPARDADGLTNFIADLSKNQLIS